jgi:hypothetical protein
LDFFFGPGAEPELLSPPVAVDVRR